MLKPGNATWPSYTQGSVSRTSAAYSWLHRFRNLLQQGVEVRIGDGRLSRAAQNLTILKNMEDGSVWASMGNFVWAAMGSALERTEVDGQVYWFFKRAPVEFLHIYNVSKWVSLTFSKTRLERYGLVLKQLSSDEGTPLIVDTLRRGLHSLLGQY
jgi:hypothetical protein